MKAALEDVRPASGHVEMKTKTKQAKSLVIGGTGLVGGYIVGTYCASNSGRSCCRGRSGTRQAWIGFGASWEGRTR
jgi:hypothetical protein